MRQTIQLNDTNGCETPVANHKICAQLPESVCDGLPIRSALLNAKQLRERHLGQDDVLRKGRNQPPIKNLLPLTQQSFRIHRPRSTKRRSLAS